MAKGRPPEMTFRVVDGDTTSTEIIRNLPIIRARWNVRALLGGIPGATTIGDFSIWLPPAGSRKWRRDLNLLTQLKAGQRVEGYMGKTIAGFPRVSGIITQTPMLATDQPCELHGFDNLWELEKTQLFPGEPLGAGGTFRVLEIITTGLRRVVWDDDFSGFIVGPGHTHSDYTNSGGWGANSADPQFKQPNVLSTTSSAVLTTNTTWNTNQQYNWPAVIGSAAACMVEIEGVLVSGTDTTQSGSAEVLFQSDAAFNNGFMARLTTRQTGVGTGLWNVNVEIWTTTGGTGTMRAQKVNQLTNQPGTITFELQAVLWTLGTSYVVHLFLNGQDTGCEYAFTGGLPYASGSVGIRTTFNAGGSPACYVNKLKFDSREGVNWGSRHFTDGTVSSGQILPQTIRSTTQSHMDLLQLAATTDGVAIRKIAGVGTDQLDYVAQPGKDLSGAVVFDRHNSRGWKLAPIADLFASASRVNAVPGGDTGGSVTFSPTQPTGARVLLDTIQDIGIPGATLLMGYARSAASRKAFTTSQAVQILADRIGDQVDQWRELDFVTCHRPELGINHQKLMVIGYSLDTMDAEQTVWFTQFPEEAIPQAPWTRIRKPIAFIGSSYLNR